MKKLFLLLVLLNLGFFVWQFAGNHTDEATATVAVEKATGMVLLRELNADQLQQLSPAAEPPAAPAITPPLVTP